MSHCPGTTLEDWVAWNYSLVVLDENDLVVSDPIRAIYHNQLIVSTDQLQQLVVRFEPHREYVERKMDEFDEENQSWRSYAGAVFDDMTTKEFDQEIIELIKSWNAERTVGVFCSTPGVGEVILSKKDIEQ